jgi:hypothetical protein
VEFVGLRGTIKKTITHESSAKTYLPRCDLLAVQELHKDITEYIIPPEQTERILTVTLSGIA